MTNRVALFEQLEKRLNLSGDCSLEAHTQDEAATAVQAVNCLALDLYEHYQNETGNLFFSPLSVATSLAMAYAGAAGDTAQEMEEVLHLDPESGVHPSFRSLLGTLTNDPVASKAYILETANAMWPDVSLPLVDDFVTTIEADYFGEAQNLDYSNPTEAQKTINAWFEQKTRGTIKDLIQNLSPATVMTLANSVYLNASWQVPFGPSSTEDAPFHRNDGTVVDVPLMTTRWGYAGNEEILFPSTELGDFQVLDMPFVGGDASMVFILPKDRNGACLTGTEATFFGTAKPCRLPVARDAQLARGISL